MNCNWTFCFGVLCKPVLTSATAVGLLLFSAFACSHLNSSELGQTEGVAVKWNQASLGKLSFDDPAPQRYQFVTRASEIDARVKAYPKIGFHLGTPKQPADLQHASVDTRVAPRGKLVIWMMAHNRELFERLNSYGIHAIRVHYANKWFSICCQDNPVGEHCRGNIRLEAAVGQDFSDEVNIARPDSMAERAIQYVKWLDRKNPTGGWSHFLNADKTDLRWDDIIMAGSSHGSTTAARFAKHQKVSRVVTFCGPRDQYQTWQSLKSATPENRYFGFTHTLDGGWTGDHYCRSWEMLGMHQFGKIVNVDEQNILNQDAEQTAIAFGNTRRLITNFDVGGDAKRAHGSVLPGKRAFQIDKVYQHENVWRYLFTHPVDQTGLSTSQDPTCLKEHK